MQVITFAARTAYLDQMTAPASSSNQIRQTTSTRRMGCWVNGSGSPGPDSRAGYPPCRCTGQIGRKRCDISTQHRLDPDGGRRTEPPRV